MDVPGVITISGFVEVCANSRDVSPQCGAFPKLGVAVLLREPSDSRRPFVCKDVSKDESFFGGGSMCVVDARVAAVVIPSSVLGVAFTVCAIEPGLIVGCVVDNNDPGDLVPSAEFPRVFGAKGIWEDVQSSCASCSSLMPSSGEMREAPLMN